MFVFRILESVYVIPWSCGFFGCSAAKIDLRMNSANGTIVMDECRLLLHNKPTLRFCFLGFVRLQLPLV